MTAYNINDEVTVSFRGSIVKIDADYHDKKVRYTVKGVGHCITALVTEDMLSEPRYSCEDCGREFPMSLLKLKLQPNGRDDNSKDYVVCSECYDYKGGE